MRNFIKDIKRMIINETKTTGGKIKIIFYCIVLITLIVYLIGYTLALYETRNAGEAVNVRVANMEYTLISSDFNTGTTKITVPAGSTKEIEIEVTSKNRIESKIEVYYEEYPITNYKIYGIDTIEDNVINTIGVSGVKRTVYL